MRAPQYGHNRGKHRGKNPMSLPIGVRLKPSLVPVSGAITVRSLNKPVSISLWHKSADVMLGSGRPDRLRNMSVQAWMLTQNQVMFLTSPLEEWWV